MSSTLEYFVYQETADCRHSKCESISTVLYSFSDINCVLYADPNLLCTVPVLFIYICLSGVHCVPVLFIYICLSGVLCILYLHTFIYLVYFVYCTVHTFVYLVYFVYCPVHTFVYLVYFVYCTVDTFVDLHGVLCVLIPLF